jgi:TonB family protein
VRKPQNIFLAIIASLALHAMVLGWLYFAQVYDEDDIETMAQQEQQELLLDFVEFELVEQQLKISDPAANLVANQQAETTNEKVSYSSKSKKRAEQEVYDALKEFEQKTFEELAADHPDYSKQKIQPLETHEHEDYDWFNESYEGSVQISYSLDGRDHERLPNPGYRCRASGTVTVNIEVSQQGDVVNVDINPSKTTTSSECLLEEAMKYARQSGFNSSFSWPKKHRGTITYIFTAQ